MKSLSYGEMNNININDSVMLVVKRINVIAKVVKIENDIATCSFYMPRSKGMSITKVALSEITKIDAKENIDLTKFH